MKIVEQDIKKMVAECLRGLINEISTTDAYSRFYLDSIPEDTWTIMMSGVTNMTPFHKAFADFLKVSKEKGMYLEETWMKTLALDLADSWNKGHEAQQVLLDMTKNGKFKNFSPVQWKRFLVNFKNKKRFTETEFLDGSLVKLYEDDEYVATCTLSYSASRKYFGDTHWCTASGIDGDYDGHRMFNNYTHPSILVQISSKVDRQGHTYQGCVENSSGKWGQICDFNDKSMSDGDLLVAIGSGRYVAIVQEIRNNFDKLSQLTTEYCRDEDDYWVLRTEKWENKVFPKMREKINSEEVEKLIAAAIENAIANNEVTTSGRFFFIQKNNYVYHEVADFRVVFARIGDDYVEVRDSILTNEEVGIVGRMYASIPEEMQHRYLFRVDKEKNSAFIDKFNTYEVHDSFRVSVFRKKGKPIIVINSFGDVLVNDPDIDVMYLSTRYSDCMFLGQSSSPDLKYRIDTRNGKLVDVGDYNVEKAINIGFEKIEL